MGIVGFLVFPSPAGAGDISQDYSDLMNCRPIEDPFARLKCFDAAAAQFHDDVANEESSHEVKSQSWAGNGGRNLPPFSIFHPWWLTWQSSESIDIAIMKSGTPGGDWVIADTASSDATQNGRSYEEVTGNFYLQVASNGTWTVSMHVA